MTLNPKANLSDIQANQSAEFRTVVLIFKFFIEIIFSSCGSGLSGEVLTDEGHHWVGLDISQAMLGMFLVKTSLNATKESKIHPTSTVHVNLISTRSHLHIRGRNVPDCLPVSSNRQNVFLPVFTNIQLEQYYFIFPF